MASITLAESAKLSQNELVVGIIESVISVNPMFDVLPFDSIEGNALAYNREIIPGGAGVGTVGTSVAAAVNPITGAPGGKIASTYLQITASLTTILGDAEVNGLIQATRSNIHDQKATQIASKAKTVGRIFQHMLVQGTGVANQFAGLPLLCAAGQLANTGVAGSALSFTILDELIDLVKDKDGVVDYFTMPARTVRAFFALLRALGGASINDTLELPSGRKVPQYRGIPVFVNDWIPTNVVKGGTINTTSIFAGTFDDGSRTHGIAGLTARSETGIQVVPVGEMEDQDTNITRVKWYAGLALFSELGLAQADGITN